MMYDYFVRIVYRIQHTAYSIQHTAYSIQHTVYSIQYIAHTVYRRERGRGGRKVGSPVTNIVVKFWGFSFIMILFSIS